MTQPDRCWYTLRYRPSVWIPYQRTSGFIALRLNDTVIIENNPIPSDEITLTLKNMEDGSEIGIEYEAGFAGNDTIYIDLKPKVLKKMAF